MVSSPDVTSTEYDELLRRVLSIVARALSISSKAACGIHGPVSWEFLSEDYAANRQCSVTYLVPLRHWEGGRGLVAAATRHSSVDDQEED